MRAFVAIEIPDPQVVQRLVAFQKKLQETRADLRIVGRENLHYTIRFLGEITEAQAAEVDKRLKTLALAKAAVTSRGVGAFPSPKNPRVVWVGTGEEDSKKMHAIAGPVIESLRGVGEEDNRAFQAHLTLARVRSRANRQNLEKLLNENQDTTFGEMEISEFKLKSSVLTPRGPIYSDVGVYYLN